MTAITKFELPLDLVASGKVRQIYALDDPSLLLFTTTDRISAFDMVLNNAVDEKGSVLTQLSAFWFRHLQDSLPDLKTHFVSVGLPDELKARLQGDVGPNFASQLEARSMVVKKLRMLPIESIVRGYITGSAWSSYKEDGTVCGISLPAGLKESQKFERPMWTPSTKAEAGDHDENINPQEAAKLLGEDLAKQVEKLSIKIYESGAAYAAEHGIIIADTKFEFGIDESTQPPTVVLADEVLTPDSSRFWPAERYEVGRGQESLDKQPLRDWLASTSQKGKTGVDMPDDVVSNTSSRYKRAYDMLAR